MDPPQLATTATTAPPLSRVDTTPHVGKRKLLEAFLRTNVVKSFISALCKSFGVSVSDANLDDAQRNALIVTKVLQHERELAVDVLFLLEKLGKTKSQDGLLWSESLPQLVGASQRISKRLVSSDVKVPSDSQSRKEALSELRIQSTLLHHELDQLQTRCSAFDKQCSFEREGKLCPYGRECWFKHEHVAERHETTAPILSKKEVNNNVRPIPNKLRGVTLQVMVPDLERAITFYTTVFCAMLKQRAPLQNPTQAELHVGNTRMLLYARDPRSSTQQQEQPQAHKDVGASITSLRFYVHDLDVSVQKAKECGCDVLLEPREDELTPADRCAIIRDVHGIVWQLAMRTQKGK